MGDREWAEVATHRITTALAAGACAPNAVAMKGYMRDQFDFHGLKMPTVMAVWRDVQADVTAELGTATGDDLVAFAEAMWDQAEREHQYVGAKALARAAKRKDLGGIAPRHLDRIRTLITTKSWWDTVDILAPNVVGRLALVHGDDVLVVLDGWVTHEDKWLVRSAVIHQLKWKGDTDPDRLARHCLMAAPHPDFFVRKAIGWALRQYSYVDAEWVESFVDANAGVLSRLSAREAMKAIHRQRGHG